MAPGKGSKIPALRLTPRLDPCPGLRGDHCVSGRGSPGERLWKGSKAGPLSWSLAVTEKWLSHFLLKRVRGCSSPQCNQGLLCHRSPKRSLGGQGWLASEEPEGAPLGLFYSGEAGQDPSFWDTARGGCSWGSEERAGPMTLASPFLANHSHFLSLFFSSTNGSNTGIG